MFLNYLTRTLILVSMCFMFQQGLLVAQTNEHIEPCDFDHANERALQSNPDLKEQLKAIEEHTKKWISENPIQQKDGECLIIPTVVHIVATNSNPNSNISDDRIYAHIEEVNQVFRHTNAEAGNTLSVFEDVAADTEIELCLAQRSPEGFPTNGITRTMTDTVQFSSATNYMKNDDTGGKTAWPSNQYLNIWVCSSVVNADGGGLNGYAYRPGNAPSPGADGVVIAYGAFNEGQRTVNHEVGHWLNLFHPWGPTNAEGSTCLEDDEVGDTPFTDQPNYGCNLDQNSCPNEVPDLIDNIQNYMDYSSDACQTMFTLGQKARMHAVISPGGYRYELVQNNNCEPLVVASNNVTLLSASLPQGAGNCTTFAPSVEILNFGTDTLYYVGLEYSIDDGPTQNTFWSGTLAPFTSTTLEMTDVSITTGGIIHTMEIIAGDPNGLTDADPTDNTFNFSFATIPPGDTPPINEGFESSLPSNWLFDADDEGPSFEITDLASNSGVSALKPDYSLVEPSTQSYFQTDEYDLLDVVDPRLTWSMAYAPINADIDALTISISTNCGSTFEPIQTLTNENLFTTDFNSDFIPVQGEWKEFEVDLSAYSFARNVIIEFRYSYNGGGTLYIDDIGIPNEISGIDSELQSTTVLNIYPNPSFGSITINTQSQNETETAIAKLQIFDSKGQLQWENSSLSNSNSQQISLSTEAWTPGLYLVSYLENGNQKSQKILILNRD